MESIEPGPLRWLVDGVGAVPTTSVAIWDAASTPDVGQLVAVTGPAGENPIGEILQSCADHGCAGLVVRLEPSSPAGRELAQRAERVGLPVACLTDDRPWWPVLQGLAAALEGGTTSDRDRRTDDLFSVADDMAALIGGPVILEDASFRVLAYSAFVGDMDRGRAEAILGRRIPDPWLDHLSATGSLQRLRTTSDVVDLADGPWQARRRLITSVRAGRRQLGVVWVAEGDTPLPAGAEDALRRAADSAVPHLLRHLEQVDAEEERRLRHVQVLLGGDPEGAASAAELGFPAGCTFTVLAVSSQAPAVESDPDDAWSRLSDHVRLCCESFRRPAAVTRFGPGALVVVAVPADAADESALRVGQEIVRLAGSGPLAPLVVAVSRTDSRLSSMPRLRDEAVGALAALDGQRGPRCVHFRDVEAEVLVRDLLTRLPTGTSLSGLDALFAHDERNGGDLVLTLRAYLAECGSASAAAASLGVHVTTLRHRLHRASKVSNLRIDDPTTRLACDLLLRRTTP
ncbi:MAG: CdaR family transcriptional regulator [Marmoricola sp.]|nr:CdaR family transcriptional regulator [Marmoricola sp.]